MKREREREIERRIEIKRLSVRKIGLVPFPAQA